MVLNVRRGIISASHPVLGVLSGYSADYFPACCGFDADGRAGDEGLEEYIQAIEEMGTTTNQVNGVRGFFELWGSTYPPLTLHLAGTWKKKKEYAKYVLELRGTCRLRERIDPPLENLSGLKGRSSSANVEFMTTLFQSTKSSYAARVLQVLPFDLRGASSVSSVDRVGETNAVEFIYPGFSVDHHIQIFTGLTVPSAAQRAPSMRSTRFAQIGAWGAGLSQNKGHTRDHIARRIPLERWGEVPTRPRPPQEGKMLEVRKERKK